MNIKNLTQWILAALLCLIIFSCSGISYDQIYPILHDGKYDSEFPYKGSSESLERISKSVHRINSTGFYKTFTFALQDSITQQNIKTKNIEFTALAAGYADQSTSGSATTIYSIDGKVVLLTCAHVVNYPDSVFSFFYNEFGEKTNIIQSVIIKDNQSVYAAGFPEGSKLEILAIDEKNDLALIGRDYHALSDFKFPFFDYPNGKAKELEWGTFVYIFGFPINFQMVTKAIVSSPNRDSKGSFIIDAVVNRGASGAIVLAIKDGVPNFELVGIVQWVPEEEDNIIVPSRLKNNLDYNPLVPYDGDIFVKKYSSIRYGIARVISIELIKEFITNNLEKLSEQKYDLTGFLVR